MDGGNERRVAIKFCFKAYGLTNLFSRCVQTDSVNHLATCVADFILWVKKEFDYAACNSIYLVFLKH